MRLASDRQRMATNKGNGDITHENTKIWKGNEMQDRHGTPDSMKL